MPTATSATSARRLAARLLPGLTGRVFLVTAAIVCAVLAAALAAASVSARAVAVRDARRGLEQAADRTAQLLAGRGRSLAGGAPRAAAR